jgi:hypothetical protein
LNETRDITNCKYFTGDPAETGTWACKKGIYIDISCMYVTCEDCRSYWSKKEKVKGQKRLLEGDA